jgi:hypothetical protein
VVGEAGEQAAFGVAEHPLHAVRDWIGAHTVSIMGVAVAMPIVLLGYPPMTDFPSHEAIVAILRHRHEAAYTPELYQANWGHPNQLFYLIAWLLSYPLGASMACKVVVAASIAALFHFASRLAVHLGRNRSAAYLVAPVAFGWPFFWGTVTFLLGMAALLATVPTFDRFSRKPTPRGLCAVFGAVVLLYSTHEVVMFLSIGIVGLFTMRRYETWTERAMAWLPAFFAVVLAAIQAVLQRPLITPSASKYMRPIFVPLKDKLLTIPLVVVGQTDVVLRTGLFFVVAGALACFAIARLRADPRATSHTFRTWVDVHRFELLALSCFVLYGVFPYSLNSATFLHYRFLVLAWCLAVPLAGPLLAEGTPPRVLRLAAAAVPVAIVALVLPHFGKSTRLRRELELVVPHIDPGSSVANITMSLYGDPTTLYQEPMMSNCVVSERGGRELISFLDSPISPVYIKREYQWNDVRARNDQHTWLFRPGEDLKHFEYVLVQSPNAEIVDALPSALAPEAELVMESGEWHLYRSRIVSTSPMSGDWATPGTTVEGSLFDRIRRVWKTTGVL